MQFSVLSLIFASVAAAQNVVSANNKKTIKKSPEKKRKEKMN